MNDRIPNFALYLGASGLIPFGATAAAVAMLPDAWRTMALLALLAYGAVILSFLGAVHWGVAIAGRGPVDRPDTASKLDARLGWSVVPALLGWCSMLVAPAPGLVLQMLGFVACLAMDQRIAREGHLPAWYPKLRWPLTLIVLICLAAALARLMFR